MTKSRRFRFLAVPVFMAAALLINVLPGKAAVSLPAKMPRAVGPAVVTSLGQTPGALMIKMLCDQIKVKATEDGMYTAAQLVASSKNKATAPKTLFITMGTSLKGMGAAGVDLDSEVKRVTELVAAARKMGVVIVGTQIEGLSRRTDQYDELSNKTVCGLSDMLIIRKEVDNDGFFSKVAKDRKIPIAFVDSPMETTKVLAPLFGVK